MFKLKQLRLAWRQLLSDPAYSLVVVMGLAVALAASLLIGKLIALYLSAGQDAINPEQVVQIERRDQQSALSPMWERQTPFVLRKALLGAAAPISAISRYRLDEEASIRIGARVQPIKLAYVDPDITQLFKLPTLAGDLTQALQRPDQIALFADQAERLFGQQNPLGQAVSVAGQRLTVAAILSPRQAGSLIEGDGLLAFNSPLHQRTLSMYDELDHNWGINAGQVWAKLSPGSSPAALVSVISQLFEKSDYFQRATPEQKSSPIPLKQFRATPFSRLALDGAGNEHQGRLIWSLAAAAACMLFLAAINYVNLSTVRTLKRQREIGLRKSLGASPAQLLGQFMLESVLIVSLAAALAAMLGWLLAPAFADLMGLPALSENLFKGYTLPVGAILVLILGLLTSLYPAWIAIGTRTQAALSGRGQEESQSGRQLRRGLTVLQFSVAIVLSATALVILLQARAASQQDLGFQTKNLLAVDLPSSASEQAAARLRDAIENLPGVHSVSLAYDLPARYYRGIFTMAERAGHPAIDVGVLAVSPHFFSQYQIPLLAGRGLHPQEKDGLIIDQRTLALLGYPSPQAAIGQPLKFNGKQLSIRGVAANTRFESAKEQAAPWAYMAKISLSGVFTVQSHDLAATRRQIEALWPRYFPDEVSKIRPVQDYLDERYASEHQFGLLIAIASLIALLLAGFGVYALAAYTVRRKTREIVLRKLYGAPTQAIAGLLLREFAYLLAIAAALGLPLAAILSQRYQADFVVRAEVILWVLPLALLLTLALTLLASLRHTHSALRIRPSLALQM